LYECEDDDETLVVNESVDTGWPKAISTASSLLDEDSLGQLTAVHDKYHQLKCQLNALRKLILDGYDLTINSYVAKIGSLQCRFLISDNRLIFVLKSTAIASITFL